MSSGTNASLSYFILFGKAWSAACRNKQRLDFTPRRRLQRAIVEMTAGVFLIFVLPEGSTGRTCWSIWEGASSSVKPHAQWTLLVIKCDVPYPLSVGSLTRECRDSQPLIYALLCATRQGAMDLNGINALDGVAVDSSCHWMFDWPFTQLPDHIQDPLQSLRL